MGEKSFESCRDVIFAGMQERLVRYLHEVDYVEVPVARNERPCVTAPTETQSREALARLVSGYCASHGELKNCHIKTTGKIETEEVVSVWERFAALFNRTPNGNNNVERGNVFGGSGMVK